MGVVVVANGFFLDRFLGDGKFEIAGWVHNLTNRKYLLDAGNTGGSFGDITVIPAEPRFYGVQVSAGF